MAHNISENRIMLGHGAPAWHKLGKVIAGAATGEEALRLAGILPNGLKKYELANPLTGDGIGAYAVLAPNGEVFGRSVGEGYSVIQPEEFAAFAEDIVGAAEGQAVFDTMGLLDVGSEKRIFCAIRTDEFEVVEGDKIEAYIFASQGFGGGLALTAGETTNRVVCANTLSVSLTESRGSQIRVKHTRNAKERLAVALSVVRSSRAGAERFRDLLRELSTRKVSRESFGAIMDRLFGPIDEGAQAKRKASAIADLFARNDGDAFPEIKGTAYSLLNAVTDYFDHESDVRISKGRSGSSVDEARALSATFGTGNDSKTEALDIILQATEGADRIIRPVYVSSPAPAPAPVADPLANLSSMVEF